MWNWKGMVGTSTSLLRNILGVMTLIWYVQ